MNVRKLSFSFFSVGVFCLPFFLNSGKKHFQTLTKSNKYIVSLEKEKIKVKLGKKLFFDKRLSVNNTVSCATCHVPKYAFTDRKKVSEGVFGRKTERNSPSLLNCYKLKTVMYDAHLSTLEMQVIVPIQEHVEMGSNMIDLIGKLKKIKAYNEMSIKAFDKEFDAFVLTRSIAAYERSLKSNNTRFDDFYSGKNKKKLTDDELSGWKLFSEKLYCIKCHPAPDFTTFLPENNGLYKEFGEDKGRFRINLDSTQIGFFKIPSLRNIVLTYPYMHDGSLSSLNDVINHYSKGGEGHKLQNKAIESFQLSDSERKQLLAFFNTLTDKSFIKKNQQHTK